MSSAVAVSRYGSATSARSAPELMQSTTPGYRQTSAIGKRRVKTDTAGGIIDDASDDEQEDPTLYIAPASEKALVGVTR